MAGEIEIHFYCTPVLSKFFYHAHVIPILKHKLIKEKIKWYVISYLPGTSVIWKTVTENGRA